MLSKDGVLLLITLPIDGAFPLNVTTNDSLVLQSVILYLPIHVGQSTNVDDVTTFEYVGVTNAFLNELRTLQQLPVNPAPTALNTLPVDSVAVPANPILAVTLDEQFCIV